MRSTLPALTFPILILIAAASATLCAGQTAYGQVGGQVVSTTHGSRVPSSPYTAEYTVTTVRTLANGVTITQESTEKKAVDSQGRQMNATTMSHGSGEQNFDTFFHVFDPVSRTSINWTSRGKQANVFVMPEPGERQTCAINRDPTPPRRETREKPVVEQLGTTTIQGIEAKGQRFTTTIPAGAEGNDAPLVTTNEHWYATAPNLRRLVVREIMDDPRSGKTTRELTNFVQGDPDPGLFEPPQGYEIVKQEQPKVVCASQ